MLAAVPLGSQKIKSSKSRPVSDDRDMLEQGT